MPFHHILLATDLSPDAMRPAEAVAELARRDGARVTLLHVVHLMTMVPHGAPLAPPIAPIDTAREIRRAEEQLAAIARTFGDVTVECVAVPGERVHDAVCDYARQNEVDLIAISTHGRTGFRHFALGSVAEAVLRHAKVPVLCFPREEA